MTLTRRWFLIASLGIVPLLLSVISPSLTWLTIVLDLALIVATLVDFMLTPSASSFEVVREVEAEISLGVENPVTIQLRSPHNWPWYVVVRDEPPSDMRHTFCDTRLELKPAIRSSVAYRLQPLSRGDYEFGDIWLKVTGKLGLISRQARLVRKQPIKVYPNLMETAKFALMARRGRLQQVGIRAARLMGAGREFESLRDYQPDDEYRRIDWKATARRGKLISRQYEVERSQNLILVLDVGRTMMAEIDGIAKLDYAINAALLLAYVAASSDDKVGLLVFANDVQTWIAPKKGRAQVYRILDALYHVKARRAEPDYRSAFAYLASKWRRRSLMVCFTDLWDPDSSRQTMEELTALQPRHLVACVTLMDTKVLRSAQSPLTQPSDMYQQAVALQVIDDRARAMTQLQQRGVLVVDSPADKLSASLVNRYLEVKERGML